MQNLWPKKLLNLLYKNKLKKEEGLENHHLNKKSNSQRNRKKMIKMRSIIYKLHIMWTLK